MEDETNRLALGIAERVIRRAKADNMVEEVRKADL
jgi:hypothetical protein